MIRRLEKEFGRKLLELGPDFQKAIPNNKPLTKAELIALCKDIFETRGAGARYSYEVDSFSEAIDFDRLKVISKKAQEECKRELQEELNREP